MAFATRVRTMRSALPCALTAAAFLASTATGLAQEVRRTPFTLEWTAPSGCPSQAQMLDQIARTIGTVNAYSEPVAARIVVSQSGFGAFQGDVALSASGQTSRRTVTGDSCRAVSDAVALIVALAINPDARSVAPPLASTTEPSPVAPLPPSDTFTLGASALLDAQTLPSAAVGGELTASWRRRRAEIEIVGATAFSRSGTLRTNPNEGAHFWLGRAGGRGCYAVLERPVRIGPCIGAGFDWIFANGFGSDSPSNAVGHVGWVALGARATVPISAYFGLSLGLEEALGVGRPTFVIDNAPQNVVFAVPALSLRATLGAELHF